MDLSNVFVVATVILVYRRMLVLFVSNPVLPMLSVGAHPIVAGPYLEDFYEYM